MRLRSLLSECHFQHVALQCEVVYVWRLLQGYVTWQILRLSSWSCGSCGSCPVFGDNSSNRIIAKIIVYFIYTMLSRAVLAMQVAVY